MVDTSKDKTADGKVKALLQEVATIASDPRYMAFNGLLSPDDDTLATRGRGKGLRIYRELERDTRCHSVVQKRQTAVVEREWQVVPGGEDAAARRAAEICEKALAEMNFDRLCMDLLDAVLMGFSVNELMPEYRDDMWLIGETIARDQRRFTFAEDRSLRMLTKADMIKGVQVPERKFIVHTFGGKDGNPFGQGLGSKLFWPVFFKRQGIQFWLVLADRFGAPTVKGVYPQNADDSQINKMLTAMQRLCHDGVIAVPEGWVIDLLESKAGGNITTHEQLCRYMDEQMAECVLGETLTTNVGKVGSKAAADTHNDVREILVKFDADMLCATLNKTLMRWLTDWNLGTGVASPRVWRNFTEDEDLNARVSRDEKLARIGWHLTPERFAEIYGEGYVFRAAPPPPAVPGAVPPPDATGDSEADDAAAFAEADQDFVDELTRQLDGAAGPALDLIIERIRKQLGAAGDLAAFSESLPDLFHAIGEDDLADAIRRGLVVADLQGRADIDDGALILDPIDLQGRADIEDGAEGDG